MPRKSKAAMRGMSQAQFARQMLKQRTQAKESKKQEAAQAAVRKLRVRKADKGNIIFIGRGGERDAASKGRKGYTVYISKTGKKTILKHHKLGYGPFKLSSAELPITKKYSRATKAFIAKRRAVTQSGNAVLKQQGKLQQNERQWDFSDKVSDKIAGNLAKAFRKQASQRIFLLSANVLVQLDDKTTRAYAIEVEIARPDHIAIKLGGLKNFVRHKFYAFLARALAYDGFVTVGSANHVRRMKENKGKKRTKWTKDGQIWQGWDYETVRILRIEWKIEQMI